MLQNLHTHTTYCDGKDTPREMLLAAIEKGFDSIGFSGHGKTIFESNWHMHDVDGYIKEINALRQEFAGKIDVYLGCELDYFSKGLMPLELFDYTIGSVHQALSDDGRHYNFDHSKEHTEEAIKEIFYGNSLAYAEAYYKMLAELPSQFDFDIVGHIDLLTKFSEIDPSLIDTESKAYRSLALEALHTLHRYTEFFEVNTGAISRGYRTAPYPDAFILNEMKNLKCKLVLTSDCHNKNFLDCHFDQAKEYLKSHGIDSLYYLTANGFVGEKI